MCATHSNSPTSGSSIAEYVVLRTQITHIAFVPTRHTHTPKTTPTVGFKARAARLVLVNEAFWIVNESRLSD